MHPLFFLLFLRRCQAFNRALGVIYNCPLLFNLFWFSSEVGLVIPKSGQVVERVETPEGLNEVTCTNYTFVFPFSISSLPQMVPSLLLGARLLRKSIRRVGWEEFLISLQERIFQMRIILHYLCCFLNC